MLNFCSNLYHFVSEWSESYMWFAKWNTAIVFMGLFQGLQVSFLKSTNTRKSWDSVQVSVHEWRFSIEFSLHNIDFLLGGVSWIFVLIFSDRFTGLSPNSIDALLKVWLIYLFIWLDFLLSRILLWTFKSFVLAWWRQGHYWIWEWTYKVSCTR